jgi:hypothetical protein
MPNHPLDFYQTSPEPSNNQIRPCALNLKQGTRAQTGNAYPRARNQQLACGKASIKVAPQAHDPLVSNDIQLDAMGLELGASI